VVSVRDRTDRFEDLRVWKSARAIATETYQLTKKREISRDFALREQIRRSAISVMANVAEGFEREGDREFIQFLSQAKGSCGELRSHLWLLNDLGYLEPDEFERLCLQAMELSRLISALMKYLRTSSFRGAKFRHLAGST
jgi:four helix bundle protein